MKKRKKFIIIILSIILIILTSVLFLLFNKKEVKHEVVFELNEPLLQTIEVGEDYLELSAKVMVDNVDKSYMLNIDTSNLDVTKLGSYNIVYYIVIDEVKYEKTREVVVVDTKAPEITLDGSSVTILIGEDYQELGYKAIDNYDLDITDKVIVTNNIDNNLEGTYEVIYKVSDSSGNEFEIKREVIVKKPNVVVAVVKEEKTNIPVLEKTNYENTITKNKFTDNGIYFEGYIKNSEGNYFISLKGDNTYNYEINKSGNNYTVNISLSEVENGTYKVYINDNELLFNKMAIIERLLRAKVKDKLVTFNYDNDEVSITIANFTYVYDVLIDPGHGGYDTGATNQYITEKEMNLEVSLYERCRYLAHGLSVYMTRSSDTYGSGYGPSSLSNLQRRAYEIAYYGAISKIVYSNHHNSINNNYFNGYELLLSGSLTDEQLSSELNIVSKFNDIYPNLDNHLRVYAMDYDTESKHSKLNGQVYDFKDNYAVNRIPYQIANIKSVIYESSYLSNKDDFNWYYTLNNWLKVSEAKIEVYVNSLGISYNSDNSSCI